MANYEEARTKVTSESGRLIWVRRRNGTWWPGQILSIDQVPESSMSSRRSGTPVKLLGREDAIVDWYNVETSKRIKAFRCGEFDECIEKAEACTDNFTRIPVNYARRRDAIRHALQLERAQNSENKLEQEMAELPSPSVSVEENDQNYSISSEDTNSEEQIPRNTKIYAQDTSEVDGTEGVEELCAGVASKRKRTLTPHVREFWRKKGIISKHLPGSSSMHRSVASRKVQVGCQGCQVEAQSFCPDDILGTSLESGSKPRDVDAELLTPQRLLPYPESFPFSKSYIGIYDPSSNLFEVDVEANSENKPQNVPFICLKSRLNGLSIVGHPLDVGALDDGFVDDQISTSGSGYISSSDEGKDAPENHGDRRSHGQRGSYKQRGSSKSTGTCPARKKLRRVSSLIASDLTSLPKMVHEFKNVKKPYVQCVPLNLIYSRLNAALNSSV